MNGFCKALTLVLVCFSAISFLTLTTSMPVAAQSTASSTPSIPEFTVSIVDNSHYTEPVTTTTTDPYTGQPTTSTIPSQYIQEKYIEVKIKNQTFTPFTIGAGSRSNLYFEVRYKGHYVTEWTTMNPELNVNYSASYTIAKMYYNSVPTSGEIDFQVQAIKGHQTHAYPENMFPQTWIIDGPKSGWSNIQTINLADGTVTITPYTNPTPTQTETAIQTQDPATPTPSVPEMSTLIILPLLLAMFPVALIFKKRKTANINQ